MTFIQSGTRLVRNSLRLQNRASRISPPTSSSNLHGGTPNSRSPRFVFLDFTGWIVAGIWIQTLLDTPESTYDEELPSPDYNEGALVRPAGPGGSRPSLENPFDRLVNESGPSRGPSIRRPSLDDGSTYTPSNGRRPSNADTNPFSLASLARKALESAPAPSTATSGVIIPNKSTITEEEIQVPYGRDDGPDSMRNSEVRDSVASDDISGPDEAPPVGGLNAIGSSKWNAKGTIAPLQTGLGALGKKLGGADGDDDNRNRSTSNATLKGRLDGRPVSSPLPQMLSTISELTCC
jgi:hypothetical protein